MKITENNPITIHGKNTVLDALRKLPPGTKITARILERTGTGGALIEIGGRRLNAEFPKGVPSGNDISLVLRSRSGSSIVFGLAANDTRGEHLRKLDAYLVFSSSRLTPETLFNLAGRLKNGLPGIYTLNLFMIGIKDAGKTAKSGTAELLNRLVSLGIKNEHLVFFSYLFSARGGIILNYLMPFFKLFRDGRNTDPFEDLKKSIQRDLPFSKLAALVDDLDGLFRQFDPDKEVLLKELLSGVISVDGTENPDFHYGSIPYLDEKFRELSYIVYGNSIVVTVEFSGLGRLDILARDAGEILQISVFCDNEIACSHLKRGIKEIREILSRDIHRRVEILITTSRAAIGNVIEINTLLMQDGVFNIKV